MICNCAESELIASPLTETLHIFPVIDVGANKLIEVPLSARVIAIVDNQGIV